MTTPNEPVEGGWIAHDGSECPVKPGTALILQLRDLSCRTTTLPAHQAWSHTGSNFDIVAYRVVNP